MSVAAPLADAPASVTQPEAMDELASLLEPSWLTIVWNDPVNLMSYVSYVFRQYFGYTPEKADRLMLDVHERGKAVVSSGSREQMERDAQAMHGYGLWATIGKEVN